MAIPARERMRRYRRKRKGRSLSVWLDPDAARKFQNIKALTKATNDAIIDTAISWAYDSIYLHHCHQVIEEITFELNRPVPDDSLLTGLYRKLVSILKLDYPSASDIKDALNKLEAPNRTGKTGVWKVSQVRKFM